MGYNDELKEMLEDEDKKDDLLAALESIDGVVYKR